MEYPKNIKPQEIPVFDFLYGLGQGTPDYEPCIPGPDFLLNSVLAVETTLLEQSVEFNSSKVIIEENYRSISEYLNSLISNFDNNYSDRSFFVHIRYTAEVKSLNKDMKNKIKNELRSFISAPISKATINVLDKFIIEINETNPVYGRVFIWASTDCNEQQGCSSTYVNDIIRCLDEKNEKAKAWFESYPNRWLILLDNIQYGLDDNSLKQIRFQIRDLGLFHKLIIIDQQRNPLLII
jgi:hypothetical protein